MLVIPVLWMVVELEECWELAVSDYLDLRKLIDFAVSPKE